MIGLLIDVFLYLAWSLGQVYGHDGQLNSHMVTLT